MPEIAIAVAPENREKGAGGALLDELFVRAAGRHVALVLNVHQRNPARRLQQRKGFRETGPGGGALGITMRKDIDPRIADMDLSKPASQS